MHQTLTLCSQRCWLGMFIMGISGCHLMADGDISHTCEDANACPDDTPGFNPHDTSLTDDTGEADNDGDGYTEAEGDCDDSDAAIHPGADEVCDDIDNDCDDLIDGQDDDITDGLLWYLDNDGDEYGQDGVTAFSCTSQPPGYTEEGGDCNDENDTIHPGAIEIVMDAIDQDCDFTDASLPFLALGQYHSCLVDTAGELSCWGYSGATTDEAGSSEYVGPYRMVSTGYLHTCAITTSNEMECWGIANNEYIEPMSGEWSDLSLTQNGGCALDTHGVIGCWGSENYDELSPSALTFERLVPGGGYVSGAFTADGTLSLWGINNYSVIDFPSHTSFRTASAGNYFNACGVDLDHQVSCWGYEGYGVNDTPQGDHALVSVGQYHACAISLGKELSCWGMEDVSKTNEHGQVADVPPGSDYVHLSCGVANCCAVTADNEVSCWGYDDYGQSSP